MALLSSPEWSLLLRNNSFYRVSYSLNLVRTPNPSSIVNKKEVELFLIALLMTIPGITSLAKARNAVTSVDSQHHRAAAVVAGVDAIYYCRLRLVVVMVIIG